MAAVEQFDVFISYSSKDKAWVRGELLSRIEKAGLKAFIDFRDFSPGAPSIKECERGVVACRKTLVILTPGYLESEWCELENIMVQTLSPANRNLRLIPLLKAECEKPLRIGALTHIDFTDGADKDLAWRQLLTALGKQPEPEPPKEPRREQWFLAHPYAMPPNFTGRVAERTMLSDWLDSDSTHPLLSLRALGGFGKSALVWHWLTHDIKPKGWPRLVWWSFYEGDAIFDNFLSETLDYLRGGTMNAANLVGKHAVQKLVQALHEPGTLLVLDGVERMLRAFGGLDAAYQGDEAKHEDNDRDCISLLAESFLYNVAVQPRLQSKVLLTTRLCPRILEAQGGGLLTGCREEVLEQMQPDDAVALFGALGIRGTHTEVKTACAPYGYHPLSLRLLAGLILRDLQQPGDIATATRLDVSGDLVQRQHHVLEAAFDNLSPGRKKVLGRIACFRSPLNYHTLRALAETEMNAKTPRRKTGSSRGGKPILDLDADLRDLVARGLVNHDKREGRFDLHPIVRRYSYDRLSARDRANTHTRLRDYFAAVPKTERVTRLEDLAPVIELYHHTVRAGQFEDALELYRDRLDALRDELCADQLLIDLLRALFVDGEDRPPRLKNERDQAWTLHELATVYSRTGQPHQALSLFENAKVNKGKLDNLDFSIVMRHMARAQMAIGAFRAAESNLSRARLPAELRYLKYDARCHDELSRLLTYRGAYAESEKMFETSPGMDEAIWVNRCLNRLLRFRQAVYDGNRTSKQANLKSALTNARQTLELADIYARDHYPVEGDYVQAYWLLGAAHRAAGQRDQAERHLHEALERCRRINHVEYEADILIDLARLRAATGAADEAQRLADEARGIAERSGYVLQGADAHLELAKLALARDDQKTAREHAKEAHRLATCDGPPDYTYKVAYQEATALLARLS
jgi:tetratricopeptide (TPR) repeat protein